MKEFTLLALLTLFLSITSVAFAEIEKVEIGVGGLGCPFCVPGVKKSLKKVDSVDKVEVHLKRAEAEVYLKQNTQLDTIAIKEAVKKSGFTLNYIRVIATGNLMEIEGKTFFIIKGTGQEFLVNEQKIALKDKLSAILKDNATVCVEGKVQDHKDSPPSINIEKIELVK